MHMCLCECAHVCMCEFHVCVRARVHACRCVLSVCMHARGCEDVLGRDSKGESIGQLTFDPVIRLSIMQFDKTRSPTRPTKTTVEKRRSQSFILQFKESRSTTNLSRLVRAQDHSDQLHVGVLYNVVSKYQKSPTRLSCLMGARKCVRLRIKKLAAPHALPP